MNSTTEETQYITIGTTEPTEPTSTKLTIEPDNHMLIDIINPQNIIISPDTHNKLYNYLIDELNNLKKINTEKDKVIENLSNNLEELAKQLNETETKLNKMNNLDLLIKIKENITSKQTELNNELKAVDEEKTNKEDNNENNKEDDKENNKEEDRYGRQNINLSITEKHKNIIIVDETMSIKPKKKPAVFRKRF